MLITATLVNKSPTFFSEEIAYENLSFEAVTDGTDFLMNITNPYIALDLEVGKIYSFDINLVE